MQKINSKVTTPKILSSTHSLGYSLTSTDELNLLTSPCVNKLHNDISDPVLVNHLLSLEVKSGLGSFSLIFDDYRSNGGQFSSCWLIHSFL